MLCLIWKRRRHNISELQFYKYAIYPPLLRRMNFLRKFCSFIKGLTPTSSAPGPESNQVSLPSAHSISTFSGVENVIVNGGTFINIVVGKPFARTLAVFLG